jgi:hypothetical protein
MGLLEHLESELFERRDESGPINRCDHSLGLTRKYLARLELWDDGLVEWFGEYGGFCDCEVAFNVFDYWTPERLAESE